MDQDALDAWRIRCGFPTWEAAADALGLSKAHMSRYKSGQRPIPRIVANACAGVEARLLSAIPQAAETILSAQAATPPPHLARAAAPALRAHACQAPPPQEVARQAWDAADAGGVQASPDLAAIAQSASSGYAYAAAAPKSRLTKPRGGPRLSLLTPTPAATPPTQKKGDRP